MSEHYEAKIDLKNERKVMDVIAPEATTVAAQRHDR